MTEDLRKYLLPYCLDRQDDGRYALLNRRYKPVGFIESAWVDYAEHPVLFRLPRLTEQRIKTLSHCGSADPERIYLYNDGCVPTQSAEHMNAYLKRLAVLAALQIDTD